MGLSSLPAYPTPEPPAPVTLVPPLGRGKTMLLQALFLLAFWSGIYILHERAPLIVAAEKKAREREEAERVEREAELSRAGVGKWVSVHGDGAVLELIGYQPSPFESVEGRFTLSRNGKVLLRGKIHYLRSADEYRLERCVVRGFSEYFRYHVTGDELALQLDHWYTEDFFEGRPLALPEIELRFMLEGQANEVIEDNEVVVDKVEPSILRFKRLKE